MRIAQVVVINSAFILFVTPRVIGAQDPNANRREQPVVVSHSSNIIEQQGQRFRDLNKNGALDPYEDWRLPPSARAKDLVSRMTLEEKAGMMMHGTARSAGPGGAIGFGSGYDTAAIARLILDVGVNSFITRLGGDPRTLAGEDNELQEIAEKARLGIPLTISTDPRNHFQYTLGTSTQSGRFSQWPETLGLAATRDAALVRRFADIARQEYRAVGIEETLSPQADLATEPRWSRISGTFGEDVDLSRALVKAYVEGFQHGASGVDSAGVIAIVKHWVGYGAQKSGLDSHSSYGRFANFSGGNLDLHVEPFLGAFAAHVEGVMPTYSILEGAKLNGRPLEQVGAGFNRQLLTDLLRKRYGFQGVILTDWAITNDCSEVCRNGFPPGERPSFAGVGMPWGVEDLPKVDRFAKAVNAGVDQFGGTEEAQLLVQGVRSGQITESRLNESVYRIALLKFKQGLFENPYVDTLAAAQIVGNAQFQAEATAAQRRSLVLLENKSDILPLTARGKRVFLHGVDSATVARYGFTVVRDLARADIAIVRTNAPFQTLHPNYAFGALWHEGDLGFRGGDAEFEEIKRISAAVPTIVTVYLDRPAILTELKDRVSALVGNFGVSDVALLDVLTGVAQPEGKLPFELPSSMQEVEAQNSAVPHDTAHPLYRIGFGRRYSTKNERHTLWTENTYMRSVSRRLAVINWLSVVALAPIAKSQQTPTNPPPDERFKADILVIAPHPDDESTIAGYLAKAVLDEHRRVAVVVTTRGDAGQNLVGYEQARSLAEIREIETREALASIGITNVFFLRAPDTFGQDLPDVLRSLETSNHGSSLGEAVRFVRLTRPEVVITMLPATVVGENHEDHQAAAVIATEAFDLSGDPTWFPEQVAAPEDRLWYGNLMEGLRVWQPKKLYYYTDASHFDFVKGKGPEYSMTAVSPSQHVSYARLAAKELSFHRTQYGDDPAKALATNNLRDYEQPFPFVLAKSLVPGVVTADIMDGVGSGQIRFAPVRGYRPAENAPAVSMELGEGWAFYRRFYPAHNLDIMPGLLSPELGVGSGQHFPVMLLLHNATDKPVTFHLRTQLPPGWSVDSTSAQHSHPWPMSDFIAAPHDDFAVRIRLIAPRVEKSQWQTISWIADADGGEIGPVSLRVYVGGR